MQSLPEVARLDSLAARSRTPCGPSETMVWRRWGEGPDTVMLHGGSGGWTHWIRNIDVLSRKYSLWIPDMPGCGESDLPPKALDANSIFEHVATGIAQIAQGKPIDLVGFSFGSLVAGFIAAHHPELVNRLVLIAPPLLGRRMRQPALQSLSRPLTPDEHETAVRFNLQAMMLHHASSIDDMAVATHAANVANDRLRRRRIAYTDVMSRLKPLWRCPVYLICGREDVMAKPEVEQLAGLLGECDLRGVRIIDDAGHWVQYERPDAFHEALESCLRYS